MNLTQLHAFDLSSHTIQTGLIVLKQVKEFTAGTAAHQSTNKN